MAFASCRPITALQDAREDHAPAVVQPVEYKQLYEATRQNAKEPKNPYFRWEAEQLHDFVLFMGNTGLRPDEAKQLQHRDVTIVEDPESRQRILEIEVCGKRGIGWCKSMPGAVKPYERLCERAKPVRGKGDGEVAATLPAPTDLLFPGNYLKMFNNLLEAQHLKLDRDGKPEQHTAYVTPISACGSWKVQTSIARQSG
ncbi:site-specific recombinase, phage integrase family protein [Agrobacterium tumefaciens]|nr:site-specific recombinase, phage integrase family protein [Agrobacterium tumefaciens]